MLHLNTHNLVAPQTTIPSSPPSSPILSNIRDMLVLLREKWICDFLFTTDSAHLTALTAPVLTQNALTCDVSIARFETDPSASPIHQQIDASFVFIPAFSVSDISVGFGIQENRFAKFDPPDNPSIFSFHPTPHFAGVEKEQLRYIRDDSKGVTILLYDFPDNDCFRIEYMEHKTSTCRFRSFIHLNRTQVRLCLQEDKGVISSDRIYPAVTLFQAVFEFRPCPECGSSAEAPCSCRLDLMPPRHSQDFRSGKKHMATHTGLFQGIARLNCLIGGSIVRQIVLGSRIDVKGEIRHDLVTKLSNWAIKEHLKDLKESPLNSLFPISQNADMEEKQNDQYSEFEYFIDGGDQYTQIPFADDKLSLHQILSDLPPPKHFSDILPNPEEFLTSGFWEDGNFDPIEPGSEAYSLFRLAERIGDPTQNDSEILTQDGACTQLFQSKHLEDVAEVQKREGGFKHSYPLSDSEGFDNNKDFGNANKVESGIATQDITKQNSTLFHSSTKDDKYMSKDIAMTSSNIPNIERNQIDDEKDEKNLRAVKRQIKRERNRAAARRSNEKKKQENHARRREHKLLQEKEVMLKSTEQRLRTENLWLRQQLDSSSLGFLRDFSRFDTALCRVNTSTESS